MTGAIKYGEHSRPDPLWRLQIAHRAANGVGVITLHIAIFFGNYTAGESMTRRAVTLQHAVAVAKNFTP